MNKISINLLKCSFIGTFAEFMLMPIFALYVEKIGGSLIDVGWSFIIFNIVKGIFVLTFGRTKLFTNNLHFWVMVGFFLSAVCDCSYIFLTNQYQFFAVQVIAGIALGIINPAWEAIFSQTETKEDEEESNLHELGEKWSIWNGGADFATGIAALFGAVLVKFTTWNIMFIIMMLISLWSTYYSYLVYRDRNVKS